MVTFSKADSSMLFFTTFISRTVDHIAMRKQKTQVKPQVNKETPSKQMTLLIILLIILCVLLLTISVQIFYQSKSFQSHRMYLRQSEPPIQSWMTVPVVATHYNISQNMLYQLLDVNNTLNEDKLTIATICKQHILNCTAIIDIMNSWIPR